MGTSFVAFGQEHTDGEALKAVRQNLELLHRSLKAEGQELVLARERSDEESTLHPARIAELHNQGLLQSYIDESKRNEATPTLEDFQVKHGAQLRTDAISISQVTPLYLQLNGGTKETQEAAMRVRFFKSQMEISEQYGQKDMGPTRMQEAAILDYALTNNLKVVGLDPLSDEEKRKRFGNKRSEEASDKAVAKAEYERVQGMAKKACDTMSELAKDKGGCVVAFNMGSAHLASLEVAMREQMDVREELENAQLKMGVLVNGKGSPMVEAGRIMTSSPKEILAAHGWAQEKMENAIESQQENEQGRREILHVRARIDELSEEQLVDLSRDTQAFTDHLTSGFDNPSLDEKQVEERLKAAEKTFANHGTKSLKEAVRRSFREGRAYMEAVSETEGLTAEVSKRTEKFSARVGQEDFAQRVQSRIEEKDSKVFMAATPASYSRTIQSALSSATGLQIKEPIVQRRAAAPRTGSPFAQRTTPKTEVPENPLAGTGEVPTNPQSTAVPSPRPTAPRNASTDGPTKGKGLSTREILAGSQPESSGSPQVHQTDELPKKHEHLTTGEALASNQTTSGSKAHVPLVRRAQKKNDTEEGNQTTRQTLEATKPNNTKISQKPGTPKQHLG